tara:strand:+ start:127 stop:351 length:225 start_codon:yes stop_codon:yes gene_type:complete
MSTEQMSTEITTEDANLYNDQSTTYKNKSKFQKVDINILMDRVRAEKKREKKENIIFLSLIASVILITGVIASL